MAINLNTESNRVDVRSKHVSDIERGDNYYVRPSYVQGGSWTLGFKLQENATACFNHMVLRAGLKGAGICGLVLIGHDGVVYETYKPPKVK